MEAKEIDLYREYADYYGYVFYIAKNKEDPPNKSLQYSGLESCRIDPAPVQIFVVLF